MAPLHPRGERRKAVWSSRRRVERMVALFDVCAGLRHATSGLHAFDLPALNQRASIVANQLDVLAGSVVVANDDQK